MWKNGDKAICIDNFDWGDTFLDQEDCKGFCPKKDDIFTVIGTREFDGILYLYFKEVVSLGSDGDRESFQADAFRKLVPHNFRNDLTEQLANSPLIEEGIEKIIVEPEYA